jgi:hypothetical protein
MGYATCIMYRACIIKYASHIGVQGLDLHFASCEVYFGVCMYEQCLGTVLQHKSKALAAVVGE